jgi:hypothetical protein
MLPHQITAFRKAARRHMAHLKAGRAKRAPIFADQPAIAMQQQKFMRCQRTLRSHSPAPDAKKEAGNDP